MNLQARSNYHQTQIPADNTNAIVGIEGHEPKSSMSDPISTHGWTAVPRDAATVLNTRQEIKDPSAHRVQDISIPQTPLANAVTEYAKRELSEQTFNHSMRVYFYGTIPDAPSLGSLPSPPPPPKFLWPPLSPTFPDLSCSSYFLRPLSLSILTPPQVALSSWTTFPPGTSALKPTSSPASCTTSAPPTPTSPPR